MKVLLHLVAKFEFRALGTRTKRLRFAPNLAREAGWWFRYGLIRAVSVG